MRVCLIGHGQQPPRERPDLVRHEVSAQLRAILVIGVNHCAVAGDVELDRGVTDVMREEPIVTAV
jgi:hypothetical protein